MVSTAGIVGMLRVKKIHNISGKNNDRVYGGMI